MRTCTCICTIVRSGGDHCVLVSNLDTRCVLTSGEGGVWWRVQITLVAEAAGTGKKHSLFSCVKLSES